MKPLIAMLCLAALVDAHPLLAGEKSESDYRDTWCEDQDGQAEVVLEDLTRVDCLTEEFAVEVDWAHKWAESIGQARYYAEMTGREPAVLLIVGPGEARFLARFHNAAPGIRLYVVEE